MIKRLSLALTAGAIVGALTFGLAAVAAAPNDFHHGNPADAWRCFWAAGALCAVAAMAAIGGLSE